MKEDQNEKILPPTTLTTKQFAARWQTHPISILRLAAEGKIPSGFRVGTKRLWLISEIEAHERNSDRKLKPKKAGRG